VKFILKEALTWQVMIVCLKSLWAAYYVVYCTTAKQADTRLTHLQPGAVYRVSIEQSCNDVLTAVTNSVRQRPAAASLDVHDGGSEVVGLGRILPAAAAAAAVATTVTTAAAAYTRCAATAVSMSTAAAAEPQDLTRSHQISSEHR
jgi:hypothetical protein